MSASLGRPESPDASGTGRAAQSRGAKALRRLAAALAVILALAGIGVLCYPFATNVWASHRQESMRQVFGEPGFRRVYRQHELKIGEPFARLRIPKLGVDVMVVQGTSQSVLRTGAGHYVDTPFPG